MNPLQQLTGYLDRLERNIRWLTFARGAAILSGAALVITVALVMVMNQFSFSGSSVFISRVVLFSIVAAALCIALVVPLLRLNQKRAALEAERRNPDLSQRLVTFVERRHSNDPFLPLLASDSLFYAATVSPDTIAAPSRAMAFGSVALIAAAMLLWLGMRGPGYFGYGASLLWSVPKEDAKAFYTISLEPGNHRIRRHSDQIISARLNGFFSRQASVFVRYASASKWEEAAMRPQPDGSSFQFLLVGVPENVDYYAVSNGIHSPTSTLTAVDLPQVTHLRVTFHFPRAYARKEETEDPGGDLRAIQGTIADLDIETDKPLSDGYLVLDDGKRIELTGSGATHHASVPIEKDGSYHVAAMDGGQLVRLSDDYFIEARRDSPPVITILRPNRDTRATPIEEVPVEVQARDDNGVLAMDLHYSVNGGPEQTRSILGARGAKDMQGGSLLSLEDFKLVPGDIVSVYATARDALTTSRSDIYFIEARPFEFSFHQEQASGDSNGGSQDQPKIAERQKEIIAATFNQMKADKHDAASEVENARYLSGVQTKLGEEAQSLANRMKARQLEGGNPAFQQFVTNMESAVAAMSPASDDLKGRKWNDALSPEQKALQYLLRAEAIFRDIQVTMGRAGGAGGGGGASRDIEGLTNLELDTQKNQYESGSQSAADQKQKEADEALKKLEDLAKRQQQLAQQQQSKQNFQQRWEQEMLRREAEQLRQKLEDLARNQQSQQGQQGSQPEQGEQSSSSQSSGQQSPSNPASRSGQQQSASRSSGGRFSPGTQQALDQALQNISEAERKMGEAASHSDKNDAQRAAEQLNRAESAMSQMRQQQNGSQMRDAMQQSRQLAEKQRAFDEKLRHEFSNGASEKRSDEQNQQLSSRMADEKRREIDDLHQLEHALQQAARGMQNTQPDAAKKLRDAIGQMQQDELESRMRWTTEALKKGLGSYAVMREAPVTRELEDLRDKLGEAQSAMKGDAKQGSGDEALQQALDRASKLRRDLQAASGDKPGQQQENGSPDQQSGKQGQRPGTASQGKQESASLGQRSGQNEGSQGQSTGERSGESPAGSAGPVGPAGSGSWNAMNLGGPPDAATVQRHYEEAVREFSRLSQTVRSDPGTAKQMNDLLRELQRLDPRRFGSDPQRLAALEQQILADAEQAELILRRKLDDERGAVRTSTPQNIPPGYANAVAEYFRRLSQ